MPASESCPALPDLPEWKPVSPGLAYGAFLFDDPCLGHLPEVITSQSGGLVDRSSYNANRSLVVSGMPILVIARRQSR